MYSLLWETNRFRGLVALFFGEIVVLPQPDLSADIQAVVVNQSGFCCPVLSIKKEPDVRLFFAVVPAGDLMSLRCLL